MKKIILALVLVAFAAQFQVTAQTKTNTNTTFQATYESSKSLVETQQYQFNPEWIFVPNEKKRNRIADEGCRSLIVKSNVIARLPLSLDETAALNINGALKDYKVAYNDAKLQINVSYKVETEEGLQRFELVITSNGSASLSVNTSKAVSVSYLGTIKAL